MYEMHPALFLKAGCDRDGLDVDPKKVVSWTEKHQEMFGESRASLERPDTIVVSMKVSPRLSDQ
jgi:hypothetical protein